MSILAELLRGLASHLNNPKDGKIYGIKDDEFVEIPEGFTGGGVQSVTGDGVDNTDPANPTISFPTLDEIGAESRFNAIEQEQGNQSSLISNLENEQSTQNQAIQSLENVQSELIQTTQSLENDLNNKGQEIINLQGEQNSQSQSIQTLIVNEEEQNQSIQELTSLQNDHDGRIDGLENSLFDQNIRVTLLESGMSSGEVEAGSTTAWTASQTGSVLGKTGTIFWFRSDNVMTVYANLTINRVSGTANGGFQVEIPYSGFGGYAPNAIPIAVLDTFNNLGLSDLDSALFGITDVTSNIGNTAFLITFNAKNQKLINVDFVGQAYVQFRMFYTTNAVAGPMPNIVEYTNEFYSRIATQNDIVLESGNTYIVSTAQLINLDKRLHFKTSGAGRATIVIGQENVEPWDTDQAGAVFNLLNNAEFFSDNINWCIPPQLKITSRYILNLFTAPRDINATWTAIVRNCDTTVLGRNGGMGAGFLHGSLGGNYVAFINCNHAGGSFSDLKNSDPNCVMYLVLQDVETDYLNPDEFNPVAIPCRVRFTTNFSGFQVNGFYGTHCAEVEAPISFRSIANQFYNRGWNNRMNMINIDRFVFWLPSAQFLQKLVDPILGNTTVWNANDISSLAEIGNKILIHQIPTVGMVLNMVREYDLVPNTATKSGTWPNKIRSFVNRNLDPITHYPTELQCGDVIRIAGEDYTVIHKERGANHLIENEHWWVSNSEAQMIYSVLTLDRDIPPSVGDDFNAEVIVSTSAYLLDGQYRDAYIVQKANWEIDLDINTPFGEEFLIDGPAFYHLSYNHKEISLWAENVNHRGFYRQSDGLGTTLGYNMINCTGFGNEFNPPVAVTTNVPMPSRITDIINPPV